MVFLGNTHYLQVNFKMHYFYKLLYEQITIREQCHACFMQKSPGHSRTAENTMFLYLLEISSLNIRVFCLTNKKEAYNP